MQIRFAHSLTVALVLCLVLGTGTSCSRSRARCPECGRAECANLTFGIRLDDGKKVDTCCPRCGLRFVATRGLHVTSMTVRDFDRAVSLEAGIAFYVEGSDITPCTAREQDAPKDERGCCLKPIYDRCLPSLIAFESRSRAEAVAREHGGIVKTFAEVRVTR